MNKNRGERLRENRRNYQGQFLLGFGRGKGLISVLIFFLYKLITGRDPKTKHKKPKISPHTFEKSIKSREE